MTALHNKSCLPITVVACLAGATFATLASGQDTKSELLVNYVSPSVLAPPSVSTNATASIEVPPGIDGEEAASFMFRPRRKLTQGERWEKFENEFGLTDKNPSLFKGTLELAKYRLDKTTFALNEFVQSVERALSFDYGLRPATSQNGTNSTAHGGMDLPIPFWETVQNARLKSDIDLNVPRARAFVGVRLVLPIGD
ncbi:MAG TPA: hypothetical protein VL171_03545 [Verrucomicrobiae bacterium]|nr:hypothetical protein [Verrucomicrobiae bacterium]